MVQLKIYKIIALEVDGVSNIYYLECLWIRSHSQHSVNKKKKQGSSLKSSKLKVQEKIWLDPYF